MYNREFIVSIMKYVFDVYNMNDQHAINTRTLEDNQELSGLLDFMGLRWCSHRTSEDGFDFHKGAERYTDKNHWENENMCMKVIDIRLDWCNMWCDKEYFIEQGVSIIDYDTLRHYTKTIDMIRRQYLDVTDVEWYHSTIYGRGRKYYIDSNGNIKYIIKRPVEGVLFYLTSYEAIVAYKNIIDHINK